MFVDDSHLDAVPALGLSDTPGIASRKDPIPIRKFESAFAVLIKKPRHRQSPKRQGVYISDSSPYTSSVNTCISKPPSSKLRFKPKQAQHTSYTHATHTYRPIMQTGPSVPLRPHVAPHIAIPSKSHIPCNLRRHKGPHGPARQQWPHTSRAQPA